MLAMDAKGQAEVARKIGEEPSGLPFNAVNIDPQNRAFNPCAHRVVGARRSSRRPVTPARARPDRSPPIRPAT